MTVQSISRFQGRVWGAINQGDIHGWAGYSAGCLSFDKWTNFLGSIKPVVVSQFRASTLKEGLHPQQTNSECPENILWYHKKAEQRLFLSPWLWRQRASVRVLWAGLIVFLSWPGLFSFSLCVEEWVKLGNFYFLLVDYWTSEFWRLALVSKINTEPPRSHQTLTTCIFSVPLFCCQHRRASKNHKAPNMGFFFFGVIFNYLALWA